MTEKKPRRPRLGRDLSDAIAAAMEKKGEEPVLLDLRAVSSFTNFFFIITGRSGRQTQAIADGVVEKLKRNRRQLYSLEGAQKGDWILMDYGDFVVHVFTPPTRDYYGLERVWGDAKRIEL